MKWLIVEDALRDRKGHWLEYVSTFVRGLKALGDEVAVLCDRKAEGFVMAETGAIPVLPDSIWHRMGDGAGGLKRYLRVPGHAWATFVAVRKVFRAQFLEKEDLTTESTEDTEASDGRCLARPCGAAFSNLFTSAPARDSENTWPTRSASGSASSPVTSHSLQATTPEASLPTTSYPLPATSIPLDWIFVPTVLVHHLLGWWLLLKTGSLPRESRVLLFFPNLPIRLDDVGCAYWNAGPTTKLMAWLFANLRKGVESGRVVLGVETHSMQRALEGLIQMPVAYLPHPVEFHAETRRLGGKKSPEGLTTEDTVASQAGAAFSNPSTSELSRDCENISRTRSATAPASLPVTSYAPPATSAKPIVFGCFGAARWEKGSDIFQEAIKLILKNEVPSGECQVASGKSQIQPVTSYQLLVTAAVRPLCFVIQWVEDFRDGEGSLVSIDPWLREHPQVEVIGRYFQGDEYDEQLERTDVMVLPYRSPYRLRVSRVVVEAMMHGMPVIATRDTTLFEQAEEYGVVVGCEDGSAESLAKAILEVAESFGRLEEDARLNAKTAAESFSVRYFRELLFRLDKEETNL
jgi:glycosyltransferase involved in cell wall biosynthesis